MTTPQVTQRVLFACVHNAGRSQMAAAFMRAAAPGFVDVVSAGTEPADEVNPQVVLAMAEVGIDLSGQSPRLLIPELANSVDVVVTMGCGEACPFFPGKRYLDWELPDPSGRGLAEVRLIRDEIQRRVMGLLDELRVPPTPPSGIREEVRATYANAARAAAQGQRASCCGPDAPGSSGAGFGVSCYDDVDLAELPAAAQLASLGCGNPVALARLEPGESVLDLGSGGGADALLSARRVGPEGSVYGLDMTDEMLDLAGRAAGEAGASNVQFLKGDIESVPLPDQAVDVVVSNCVINLAADKTRVLQEAFRVLRPGGRFAVSDIVAEDRLSPAQRAERGSLVGCIAGALSRSEYERGLAGAGFSEIEVTESHRVADGMYSALVRAVKPNPQRG